MQRKEAVSRKTACVKTYHHIERIKIISKGIKMINQKIFALGALVSVGLLTGCGASTSAKIHSGVAASFSQATPKWSDVSNDGNTVTAQGFTSEATFVRNTSTAAAPVIDTTGEVKINYDSSGKISGFSIKNNHVDLTWTDGFKTNIRDPSLTVTDGDEADGMIYDPELTSPWDYQTMATWVLTDKSEGKGRLGAISVGNHTANASIPTTSSATFSGKAEGIYLDDAHKFHGVSSDAALTADFVNKTVSFATSNSKIHDLDYRIADQSKSDLDLTGTFSYSSAVNNLTASNLTSTSGWTGGTASAKFYGPNAEEIGGVFSIRGTGKEAYEGAFGAAKQ